MKRHDQQRDAATITAGTAATMTQPSIMSLMDDGYASEDPCIEKPHSQALVSASSSSALSLVGIAVPPGNAGTWVART